MKKILLRRAIPLLCCVLFAVSVISFPVSAADDVYCSLIDWRTLVEKSEVVAGQEYVYLKLPVSNIYTYPYYGGPGLGYYLYGRGGLTSPFYGNGNLGYLVNGFVSSPFGTEFIPMDASDVWEWYVQGGSVLDFHDLPDDTTATVVFSLTLNSWDEEYNDWESPTVSFANYALDTGFDPFEAVPYEVSVKESFSYDSTTMVATYEVTFPLFVDGLGYYSAFLFQVDNLPDSDYDIFYDSFTMNFTSESLQSEDAKTNELLQSILDAMSGSTNPKPPSGSGSVGDLGSIEDSLLGDSAAGRDEFQEFISTAIGTLHSYVAEFSFMVFVMNCFIGVGWIRNALVVSLSLGVFGYLVNIGFKAAGDARAGGSSGKGKGKGG